MDPTADTAAPPRGLTAGERQHYDEHGYVVVRDLFPPADVVRWQARFLAVVNEEVEPVPGMLVMRDVMVAKGAVHAETRAEAIAKIQDFQQDAVLFDGYVKHPAMLGLVRSLVGDDVKSIHTMLINKPPHVDGRHPLHQDLLYFPFRPADQIVGTWTALEASDRQNGCLVVVPGSHKGELLRHVQPEWEYVNFAYFGAEGVDAGTERVHLEMAAGDTVLFHPMLVHGSGRNRSEGFRRAISAHYASAACRFLPGAEPVGARRAYVLVHGREHADGI